MKRFYFFIAFLTLTSCSKDKYSSYNQVHVLGHGGMGITSLYPLNSYESIFYSLALGAEGTEIDVQMTSDSVLVAYHNRDLSEKTNMDGRIHQCNYTDIREATYTLPLYSNYQLANLEEIFNHIDLTEEQIFFLDCKNYNPDATVGYMNRYTDALIRLVDQFDLKDKVFIELKRRDLIETMRAKRPDIKLFTFSSFEAGLEMAEEYNLSGLTISIDNINKDQVDRAHAKGIEVAVFNTHTKARNVKAIEIEADYIQTDKLKQLFKLLGR